MCNNFLVLLVGIYRDLLFHVFFGKSSCYNKVFINKMDCESIWTGIFSLCGQVDAFVTEKSGVAYDVIGSCHKARSFIDENKVMVMIVMSISLILMAATAVLRRMKGKVKVFEATLLNVKEITHDTKIFTFDLPSGWNKIGLNIGEHLTLT